MGSLLSKPSAPTPPNPVQVAGAQTSTNVSTALANAALNNVNQQTPLGNLDYNITGNYNFTDPTSGATYDIPRYTATQTLSPQEQAIQEQGQGAKLNLASLANSQSARLGQVLGQDFNPLTGAPTAGDAGQISGVPKALTEFGASDPITKTYGPQDSFGVDRSRIEDALYNRLNPQLGLERSNIEQRLADQGIRYGSDAYNNAMMDYNRQANDARLAVTQFGGQEQSNLMNMAAQQAAFQNAAQQQGFSQNALRGQFANAGLAQQMAAAQAAFNASNASRGQYLNEQYTQRTQPINEITALLSGSQVSRPSFGATPTNTIPTTDFAGLTNQNFAQQLGLYNTQNANAQGTVGGLFGLASNLYKVSDVRTKKDIRRLGSVMSIPEGDHEQTKLPVYEYAYKADPAGVKHVGPMAQDVEKMDPQAVRSFGGVKHIDTRRVMGSIMRAA